MLPTRIKAPGFEQKSSLIEIVQTRSIKEDTVSACYRKAIIRSIYALTMPACQHSNAPNPSLQLIGSRDYRNTSKYFFHRFAMQPNALIATILGTLVGCLVLGWVIYRCCFPGKTARWFDKHHGNPPRRRKGPKQQKKRSSNARPSAAQSLITQSAVAEDQLPAENFELQIVAAS